MIAMPWPLSAFLAWGACWLVFDGLLRLGMGDYFAMLGGVLCGALLTRLAKTDMRRLIILAGFPLSLLGTSAAWELPGWGWLSLFAAALLIYPLNAWGDAPLFPTPKDALRGLPDRMDLPPIPRILDAGSGLGDGLIALRRAFPRAELHGIEMSWPLRLLSALRCPWARIRQGDIWAASWADYDVVYLFQRPETMPRAVEKAQQELKPGAWLVSLEFEARTLQPQAAYTLAKDRPVWIYRAPFTPRG